MEFTEKENRPEGINPSYVKCPKCNCYTGTIGQLLQTVKMNTSYLNAGILNVIISRRCGVNQMVLL